MFYKRLKLDALTMLKSIETETAKVVVYDPEYRDVLDYLSYGNEGKRQKKRVELPQMSAEQISAHFKEIERILTEGGYCFLWIDRYILCEGVFHDWTSLKTVDMITWEKNTWGNGARSRRKSEILLVLQKKTKWSTRANWKDHSIPDVWFEKRDNSHPHTKPVNLQTRLICAVTEPGDLVVDPCAGSFSVLDICKNTGRLYLGTDIVYGEED